MFVRNCSQVQNLLENVRSKTLLEHLFEIFDFLGFVSNSYLNVSVNILMVVKGELK